MSVQLSRARVIAAPLARGLRPQAQARSIHIDNVVGNNTPFNYQKKTSFTALYVTSLCVGAFVIPAVAVGFQLKKGGGE